MVTPHDTTRPEVVSSDHAYARRETRLRRLEPSFMEPEIRRSEEHERFRRRFNPGVDLPCVVTRIRAVDKNRALAGHPLENLSITGGAYEYHSRFTRPVDRIEKRVNMVGSAEHRDDNDQIGHGHHGLTLIVPPLGDALETG